MKLKILFLLIITSGLAIYAQDIDHHKNEDIPITDNNNYTYETVVDELSVPWGLEFLPDGSLLITEQKGTLIHFINGKKQIIEGVPEVYFRGQGGLLDIKIHPDYVNNGWIYITFSSTEGAEKGGNTSLMRARLDGNKLIDKQVLYKASPNTTKGQHWGSRIAFDNEGHVFFSAGQRGERDVNPQDITRDNGKIYRLNNDGSIPKDNPFVGIPNAKEAIWSYGHRNPQGMDVNPKTGTVWVHEHGPRGGDEINIIKKGANYGWPVITYGINYSGTEITEERSRSDMQQPLYYWIPSIAPSGLAFIHDTVQFQELNGNILVGSLKYNYLEALYLDENDKVIKREKLLADVGRVRNVKQAPDGNIFISVEGKGILKLVKK
ncbi:MAG: PQQ-dependent sugar dehydrogenase [Leeuwenhoekiella sp.]